MAAGKDLSKKQYENLASFRYAVRQFLRFSEEAALTAGVTVQQHQALLAIRGFPGREVVSVGELAERLQLRHHSTVELLKRLTKLKLVSRKPSLGDRRKVDVQLTARGRQILTRLSSVHEEQLRRIGPELRQMLEQFETGVK